MNWFGEWERHGFAVTHEGEHDYRLPFTADEWCGKIRSVSWMTDVDETTRMRISAELKAELEPYGELVSVPHRLSVVSLRS